MWIDGKLKPPTAFLALGSYSPVLQPLGIEAPVGLAQGLSLTVPIANAAMAPTSTILDQTYKVAITCFDNRIRVGGMAEIAGFDLSLNPRRRETLEMITNDSTRRAATSAVPNSGPACARPPRMARRSSAPPPIATCSSTPDTVPLAGPWPAAPVASSPT